jgi:hypothetical protein
MIRTENGKISVLGIACLLTIAVIIVAGLWPFDFNPVNKVEWLRGSNGVRFYGQGMVVSRQPMTIGTSHFGTDSISIEIIVLPHEESINTVASIVTLYDHDHEVFMAGQWLSELIIRVAAINTEKQYNYLEIGVAKAMTKDATHFITMVSENGSTALYIDGKLEKIVPNFSLIPIGKTFSGHLLLGNSPDGTHAWNGSFFSLAIYNQALCNTEVRDHYDAWRKHIIPLSPAAFKQDDQGGFISPSGKAALYLFNERSGELIRDYSGSGHDLMISPVFQPLCKTVLEMPYKSSVFSRSNLNDIAINIAGFVPFGFFLSAWLRIKKNLPFLKVYSITLFIGFCFSLAIELIQVYVPTRDSSLMDVISNTLGTALGYCFFTIVFQFFITRKLKTQNHLY